MGGSLGIMAMVNGGSFWWRMFLDLSLERRNRNG